MADAIRKLIEAVEAGTATGGPDAWVVPREMSDLIQIVTGDDDELWSAFVGAHDGSLDDANALHDALVPGWRLNHLQQFEAGHWYARIYEPQGEDWPKWTPFPYQEATNDNPARAWLLAILRAMEAEGQP